MPAPVSKSNYQGYKGIPPIVGLENMEDACEKGLSVEDSVTFLKRHHWMMKRLREIMLFRLVGMPIYELKMAFSLHLHIFSEHVSAIRTRVAEMREPPLGLDKVPHVALDRFLEEIKYAPTPEELVLGIYEKAVPSLLAGVEKHLAETHRLFDHPTYRMSRFMKMELEEILEYGQKVIECIVTEDIRKNAEPWLKELDDCLALSGGFDGSEEHKEGNLPDRYSNKKFEIKMEPQRDERFIDPYNQGVNAEAFLFDPEYSPKAKTIMLYFKRMREIDVPEMMAPLIYQEMHKPNGYMRDMCRQLWDEARHAMMGEIGFTSIGIDWKEIPMSINFSLGLNTLATARERHAVLWFIEQGLMPAKRGKAEEWEIAIQSESKVASMVQDYDWADEVLHARIGRDWLIPQYESKEEAKDFGDKTWARIMKDFQHRMEDGLTDHKNWWPEVYKKACENWGIEPDPKELAYNKNYMGTRADLQEVGSE